MHNRSVTDGFDDAFRHDLAGDEKATKSCTDDGDSGSFGSRFFFGRHETRDTITWRGHVDGFLLC